MIESAPHNPVLLQEVLTALNPQNGEIYVDGTFGAGGYSKAILDHAECNLVAFDRDEDARKFADKLTAKYGKRFTFIQSNFGNMEQELKVAGVEKVHGIVLDIGVSSMQIDQAERGFSFQKDGPLDMRMGKNVPSAADLINNVDEKELADIIYKYGDEPKSRHIAKKIVELRKIAPINTTFELKSAVHSVIGKRGKIDPATKTFQAIRIWVNDELGELEKVLESAENLLHPNGRLVVVTFHSLEDKIVKDFYDKKAGKTESVSRYLPVLEKANNASFKVVSRKAITASEKEVENNPRARSAKLRLAVKI